jgi:2-polyprenyl-6-methoxyphenol hydroxylase-like FAD-dependent oxidoreductase
VGLTLAQCGWSVRVHERGSRLGDLGTSIWENGHKALEAVGALVEVMSCGTSIVRTELIDHHLRPVRLEQYNDTDNRALVVPTDIKVLPALRPDRPRNAGR